MRPQLEVGARVEVETPSGWREGVVEGFRYDTDVDRVDVRCDDGSYWRGCHPQYIRPVEARR